MLMMRRMKAVVHGGQVLVHDHVDFPDGTELEIDVHEPVDDLDDEELAALDESLAAGQREYLRTGKTHSVDEVMARLRARQ